MNITFLVGNGFDISLGIETSYSAFYKWYLKQPSNSPIIATFKDHISRHISDENNRSYWSDFEVGLGEYTENFTLDTIDDYIACYKDAHSSIINYIKNECRKLAPPFLQDDAFLQDFCSNLWHFYNELRSKDRSSFAKLIPLASDDHLLNFISFNYTDTLDECIKNSSKIALKHWTYSGRSHTARINPNVIHAHGTTTRFPILGVNDSNQIKNQELISHPFFQNALIKPSAIDQLGETWHDEAISLINASTVICIWGMSFGQTDKKWWTKICEWLKASGNRKLIIFGHSKTITENLASWETLQIEDSYRNRITNYGNLSPEQRKQIYVIINTSSVLRPPISKKNNNPTTDGIAI